jgi:hypothetical protein
MHRIPIIGLSIGIVNLIFQISIVVPWEMKISKQINFVHNDVNSLKHRIR